MGQGLSFYQSIGFTRDTLEGNDIYQENLEEENSDGTGNSREDTSNFLNNHGVGMNNIQLEAGFAATSNEGITKFGVIYSRGFSGPLNYSREFDDPDTDQTIEISATWIDSSDLGVSIQHLIGDSVIPSFPKNLSLSINYAMLWPLSFAGSDALPVKSTALSESTSYELREQAITYRGMLGFNYTLTETEKLSTHLRLEGGISSNGTIGNRELSKAASLSFELRETFDNLDK